jgi:hypothetical protein
VPRVKIQKQLSILQNIIFYTINQSMTQHNIRDDKVSPWELNASSLAPSAQWDVMCCILHHLRIHHSRILLCKFSPLIIVTLMSSNFVFV